MNILIIEDNPDHLAFVTDALDSITDLEITVSSATNISEGSNLLHNGRFDLCLCDLNLPDSDSEQTVEWLGSQRFAIPIVILTSINSVTIAKKLLNNGIQDYVIKDDISPEMLYKTCRFAIERWKHQREIESYNTDMKAFCSSLSHDFSGQIIRIKGVSSILKLDLEERVDLTPGEETLFNYLNTSTTEIHQLVEDLQKYLSMEYKEQTKEVVDLNKVVNKVVRTFKSSNDKALDFTIENNLPTILGNNALMHLLFHNLISNSVKFNENIPNINISSKELDNIYQITLEDNGIGFNPDKSEEMFKPFKRLAHNQTYTGSGLGLSIVKRVIEKHNGRINVESAVNKGSRFIISFLKDNETNK